MALLTDAASGILPLEDDADEPTEPALFATPRVVTLVLSPLAAASLSALSEISRKSEDRVACDAILFLYAAFPRPEQS